MNKYTPLSRYWELEQDENLRTRTLPNIQIVATKGDVGLPSELMAELPSLKFIVVYGAGYDKIDLEQARDRNIIITTTPDALTEAVADHVVALALASSRRIAEGDRFIRNGDWLNGKLGIGYSLRGKTLGIFGYGALAEKPPKYWAVHLVCRFCTVIETQTRNKTGSADLLHWNWQANPMYLLLPHLEVQTQKTGSSSIGCISG